jgi:uncharacterized protein
MMRPLPHPTLLSRPFWDACREGRLTAQRCSDCGELRFIPSAFCAKCLSTDYTWQESSGRGRILTLTVVHRAPTPEFETPFVVAVVRLDEGYDMFTNIVGTPPDEVHIGDAVEVEFEQFTPEITLPFFRVVKEPAA